MSKRVSNIKGEPRKKPARSTRRKFGVKRLQKNQLKAFLKEQAKNRKQVLTHGKKTPFWKRSAAKMKSMVMRSRVV